jgi:hypothetical protein
MSFSPFLEAVVIVAISVAMLWPVRRQLAAIARLIPNAYRMTSLLGAGLLLGGHVISRGEATYPVTAWDMYTASNPDDPRYVDYLAELRSGREVRLLIAQLFPAGGKHLRGRVDAAAFAVQRAMNGPDEQRAVAELEALLMAVTREYEARHPEDPIRTIRLWIGTVPARNYEGPASISRALLREYHAP